MINQVTLVGRLTRDPELKWTQDGKAVTNVTLAVTRHYKNPHGDIEADFVNCTLWGKTAENTAQYCRKGSVIGVTGRIQTRNYENQDGKKVYVTEVVAEGVRFLGGKPQKDQHDPREREPQREHHHEPFSRQNEPRQAPQVEREELPFA